MTHRLSQDKVCLAGLLFPPSRPELLHSQSFRQRRSKVWHKLVPFLTSLQHTETTIYKTETWSVPRQCIRTVAHGQGSCRRSTMTPGDPSRVRWLKGHPQQHLQAKFIQESLIPLFKCRANAKKRPGVTSHTLRFLRLSSL